MMQTAKR